MDKGRQQRVEEPKRGEDLGPGKGKLFEREGEEFIRSAAPVGGV